MNEGLDMSRYPSAPEVRQWAMSKRAGAGVQLRGQLPRFVILGWNKAHPDRPYVASESHHGTEYGYLGKDCRCNACAVAGPARRKALRHLKADEAADELVADR